MGTGVLSLPYAARTLGWVWTMIAIPLFAWCAAYSGWLLAAVKKEHSSITSYADASKLLFSSRFGAFTEKCMLINWGALAVYYMIALSEGIGDLFGSLNCDHERSLVAVAILILPCQW
jgi:amino acid permease